MTTTTLPQCPAVGQTAVTPIPATPLPTERGNGQPWPFDVQMLEKCQTPLQTEIILTQMAIARKGESHA